MRRAFVYRLYPTRRQAEALAGQLEATRQLYNAALEQRRTVWHTKRRSISVYQQLHELPDLRRADADLGAVHSHVCQTTLRRLDVAFRTFFRRVKAGESPGYPRFKGRDRWNSLVFSEYGNGAGIIDGRLRVFGAGHVKLKLHRLIIGTIKTVTLKRSCRGHWSAIFSCSGVPSRAFPATTAAVGIDMGLTSYATLSTGEKIDNPRWYRQMEEKLSQAQRALSAKRKGTNARRTARHCVARLHEKVREQRRDFHHKLAHRLVSEHGFIAVEKLNTKNLIRHSSTGLRKSITDAAWARFLAILGAKAEEAGRRFVKVPPHNTSSTCSGCGRVEPKVLSERVHICPCGLALDRDHNAALNVLRLGRSRWENISQKPRSPDRGVATLAVGVNGTDA
jgi:putative transposase